MVVGCIFKAYLMTSGLGHMFYYVECVTTLQERGRVINIWMSYFLSIILIMSVTPASNYQTTKAPVALTSPIEAENKL